MSTTTIRSLFKYTQPRQPLCELLRVQPPYISGVAKGVAPGPKVIARFTACVLIPKFGRRGAAEILLASFEQMHPKEFATAPAAADVLAAIGAAPTEAATAADKAA